MRSLVQVSEADCVNGSLVFNTEYRIQNTGYRPVLTVLVPTGCMLTVASVASGILDSRGGCRLEMSYLFLPESVPANHPIINYSLFIIPYSLFPIHCSLFLSSLSNSDINDRRIENSSTFGIQNLHICLHSI